MGFTVSVTTSHAPTIKNFKQAFETIQTKININPAMSIESQGSVYAELSKLTQSFKQANFAQFQLSSDGLLALSDLIIIFNQLKKFLGENDFNTCLQLVRSHLQKHRMQEELSLTSDSIVKIFPYLVDNSPAQEKEMLFEEISLHLQITTSPLEITQICNFIFCTKYISDLEIKYAALTALSLHVKNHRTAISIGNKAEYDNEKMANTFKAALECLVNLESEIKGNPSFSSFLSFLPRLSIILTPFARNTINKKFIEEAKRENQQQTSSEYTPFRPTQRGDLNKATSSRALPESSTNEDEALSFSEVAEKFMLPN